MGLLIQKCVIWIPKSPIIGFSTIRTRFKALLNAIFVVFSSFFKDVHGEASSVRIAIGPFAQASNVVEEPDGYVNKLVTTALRK